MHDTGLHYRPPKGHPIDPYGSVTMYTHKGTARCEQKTIKKGYKLNNSMKYLTSPNVSSNVSISDPTNRVGRPQEPFWLFLMPKNVHLQPNKSGPSDKYIDPVNQIQAHFSEPFVAHKKQSDWSLWAAILLFLCFRFNNCPQLTTWHRHDDQISMRTEPKWAKLIPLSHQGNNPGYCQVDPGRASV